jgi:hypothetical protein
MYCDIATRMCDSPFFFVCRWGKLKGTVNIIKENVWL